MAGLTMALGQFVSDLAYSDVPAEGLATAKTGITDCFGVMVAGARDPAVGIVDRELSAADGTERAPLVPSGALRNTDVAALVNGVAAHVLDYDDATLDGHPSAAMLPAILAQGYVSGSSGTEMLVAYVAGYEVWSELIAREPAPLHQKGWHPSSVRGAVAAAAACAKLRNLGPRETAIAMAMAGSMSGGLVANFGSLTKSFQVGRAAQSGLIAARLAAAGLTASTDAFEHKAGFLVAFSPTGEARRDLPLELPKRDWDILRTGLNIKRYPNCYCTHRAIDATIDLVERHDLRPHDVDHVRVSTGKLQMHMLRNDRPQTAFEAKFSMQFAVATSVVARKAGLGQFVDSFVRDEAVQAILPRVTCDTMEETMEDSVFAPWETVEITTTGGQVLASERIVYAKGNQHRPLTRDELWDKFSDCLADDLPSPAKERTFDRLLNLERLNRPADLFA